MAADRIAEIQQKHGVVGRASELALLSACGRARRHVLLEGPVGVGKTALARAVAASLGRPITRVDGDGRYTEQKLTGWFDPPVVMKSGYTPESFLAGPLVEAMKAGGVLFVNELNRMPEGVQNVLLPALDEGIIVVPKLGVVKAAPGFWVIATQNPREFVATSHLSEALLDRFELVRLEHPPAGDELEITRREVGMALEGETKGSGGPEAPREGARSEREARASADGIDAPTLDTLVQRAVAVVRGTRQDPRIRRGASVRAAISIAVLAARQAVDGASPEDAFTRAVALALPNRIELSDDSNSSLDEVLKELSEAAAAAVKKKTVS